MARLIEKSYKTFAILYGKEIKVKKLGRYLFSYLRAITQESVGYEATADERIQLGDILKRVSLGFFSKNNMGELSAAATTDLSFMESQQELSPKSSASNTI